MFDEVASFVSRTHLGFIHHESVVYSKVITSSAAENGEKQFPNRSRNYLKNQSRQIWKTFIPLDRASKT